MESRWLSLHWFYKYVLELLPQIVQDINIEQVLKKNSPVCYFKLYQPQLFSYVPTFTSSFTNWTFAVSVS